MPQMKVDDLAILQAEVDAHPEWTDLEPDGRPVVGEGHIAAALNALRMLGRQGVRTDGTCIYANVNTASDRPDDQQRGYL